jgi:tetratricopeptide (TPR) repeat protein
MTSAAAPVSGASIPSSLRFFEDRRELRLILCLLLVLITLTLYAPTSHAPYFSVDDQAYVFENYHVRQGLSWDTVKWAFSTTDTANWHPLTWISHSLDVQMFGLKPEGPHYVNVLLHAVNATILFFLLLQCTRAVWSSFVVAFLFAVHPLNVESVAWISERKNLLSMFFLLIALAAYGWYARKPSVSRYLLLAVCFALGLMTKPQVITLPFALLLLDYWPLQRTRNKDLETGSSWTRLVVEKLPLMALSGASAWITMKAQKTAMHMEFPLSVRLENAVLAYAKYIGKTVWPAGLGPMYPHPGLSVRFTYALLAALLLAAITSSVVFSGRRYLVVGWLWFLGTLVPMLGLIQVGMQAMADRYAYIPCIGLFVMACWGIGELLENRQSLRVPALVIGGVALTALALACYRQIGYWKDDLALWTHTLNVTENSFYAEDGVGMALTSAGRLDEAAMHFHNAARINPDDPIAAMNLGVYEQLRGNSSAAIAYDLKVLRLTQDPRLLARTLTSLGYIYYAEKQLDSSRQSFRLALIEMPESAVAWTGLGLVTQTEGDVSDAVEDYANAVRIEPNDVGYILLAQALEKQGSADKARAARAMAGPLSHDVEAANRAAQRLLTQ